MNNFVVLAIFLLAEIVWARASPVHGKEALGPRVACPTSYAPYCDCNDYNGGRTLGCTVYNPEDFVGIRSLLSADSYIDYYTVFFNIAENLDIPADVLGGKRAGYIDLYYPDRSAPSGVIDFDAFRSSSNYTTRFGLYYGNLTNLSFAFLAPFSSALKEFRIQFSSIKKIKDMPYLPQLTRITIAYTNEFESWYSPAQTPNLEKIEIYNNPDLDDQKMDSILTSMTDSYTYQKLVNLALSSNALTRVPPLALSFPALGTLYLGGNPIVTLATGSVNNKANNLKLLSLFQNQVTTVEPGAFIGNLSSTWIDLGYNPMTSFLSSAFQNVLESMAGQPGYIDIYGNPIVNDCGLAWLIRDNRNLLPDVRNGVANGIRFEDLKPEEYSNCS